MRHRAYSSIISGKYNQGFLLMRFWFWLTLSRAMVFLYAGHNHSFPSTLLFQLLFFFSLLLLPVALTQPRIVASAGLRADPGITSHTCVVNLGLTCPPAQTHTVRTPASPGFNILWNMSPVFIPRCCRPRTLLKDSLKQRYASTNSRLETVGKAWKSVMVGDGFIILPFVVFSFKRKIQLI